MSLNSKILTSLRSFNSNVYDYNSEIQSAVENYCLANKNTLRKDLIKLIAKYEYTKAITQFVNKLSNIDEIINPFGKYFNQIQAKACVLNNISDIACSMRDNKSTEFIKQNSIEFFIDCIADNEWNHLDSVYRDQVFSENFKEIANIVKSIFPKSSFSQDEIDKIKYDDDEDSE